MKLVTRCKSCKEEISFNSDVYDRVDLEMKKGKTFLLTCKSCLKKNKYHVNDFTAEKSLSSKLLLIIIVSGLSISIIVSEVFYPNFRIYIFGGFFLLPSLVYLRIIRQQQVKLNSFNRYKVKE